MNKSLRAPTTVVIPALNEAAHIGHIIESLLPNDPDFLQEIIIVDGGSTDSTKSIVSSYAQADNRVRLLHNPDRIQSAGINLALRAANPKSEVIIRMDGHSIYAPGFAGQLVDALTQKGADSVVVRLKTIGRNCFQKAIAAACNSPWGAGNSLHRIGGNSRFVDHGHHAAFKRSMLERTGGYDATLIANEDAELDHRIAALGGRIWFESSIEIDYVPRSNPLALARQYWRYGRGRAQNALMHKSNLKFRQLVPALFAAALSATLLLTPVTSWGLLLPAFYLAIILAVGVALAVKLRSLCVLLAPVALAIIHLAWGSGFLRQLIHAQISGKPRVPPHMTKSAVESEPSA